jgi:septal ring factor EnvC (AmiA/AmiB activator)
MLIDELDAPPHLVCAECFEEGGKSYREGYADGQDARDEDEIADLTKELDHLTEQLEKLTDEHDKLADRVEPTHAYLFDLEGQLRDRFGLAFDDRLIERLVDRRQALGLALP